MTIRPPMGVLRDHNTRCTLWFLVCVFLGRGTTDLRGGDSDDPGPRGRGPEASS